MTSRTMAILAGCVVAVLAAGGALIWHRQNRSGGMGSNQVAVAPAVPTPAVSTPEPQGRVAAAAPAAPKTEVSQPSFDIVRTERNGETVVAGRAAPSANVVLLADGKVVAQAVADGSGAFVLLPDALKPGAHALTLQSTAAGGAAVLSTQSVAVSVPEKAGDQVVVALQAPNQPTVLLTDPTAPNERQAARPALSFKTAEVQADGERLTASGNAPAGDHVRVYLNGAPLRDLTTPPDGHWSVTIGGNVEPGSYTLRADALDGAGKVKARAEVPFNVPHGLKGTAAKPADPSVPTSTIQTTKVERGDNLWTISRKALGDGSRYTRIYAANNTQIRDPDLIYPGQVFVMPNRVD
jgi:nucleoid-associated protein YgaU